MKNKQGTMGVYKQMYGAEIILLGFVLGVSTMTILSLYKWALKYWNKEI
jgi:hypothetical protein